jgi:hypothetical protein
MDRIKKQEFCKRRESSLEKYQSWLRKKLEDICLENGWKLEELINSYLLLEKFVAKPSSQTG